MLRHTKLCVDNAAPELTHFETNIGKSRRLRPNGKKAGLACAKLCGIGGKFECKESRADDVAPERAIDCKGKCKLGNVTFETNIEELDHVIPNDKGRNPVQARLLSIAGKSK